MSGIHDFTVTTLDGRPQPMAEYAGKVLLIVNVASKCGFTPQYAGLEALWRNYRDRGLVVIGFPCDQFGHQEPGDAEEIRNFCAINYDISFPMMAKIEVNGDGASPLYRWLAAEAPGLLGSKAIKWNFTKFLINRDGQVVRRYSPLTTPSAIRAKIEHLLPSSILSE